MATIAHEHWFERAEDVLTVCAAAIVQPYTFYMVSWTFSEAG